MLHLVPDHVLGTITSTNVGTSTKCNTIVHDNIYGTKCNNNNLSYPGDSAKCDSIVVMVLLLWSYPGNGAHS